MAKPGKSPGVEATSQRQLADSVGRSQPTVQKWTRRADWPFSKTGPWDVAKVKAWAAGLQEDRATDAGGSAQDFGAQAVANLIAKNELMLLTRVKRQKLQGVLVDRSLLEQAMVGLTKVFVRGLDELERSLPFQVAGLGVDQVKRHVRDHIGDLRRQLVSQKALELEQLQQHIAAQRLPKSRGRPATPV